jgi:hypothetical protein
VRWDKYQEMHGHSEVLREKTFFEKPISTFILFVYAAAIAAMLWQVFIHDKPFKGSYFTSIGFFIAYLVAWLAGREKRREA